MTPVDYARPTTAAPAADPVLAKLRLQECGNAGAGTLMLLGGVAVTFLSVYFVTSIVWLMLFNLFRDTFIGFWTWYGLILLLLVPYLIRLERRSRGNFYSDAVTTSGHHWGNWSSYGGYQYQSTTATIYAYVEMLLIGPRLLVNGFHRLRGVEPRGMEAQLRRCAALIHDLARRGGSASAESLAMPDEPPRAFARILKHLDQRDWVGRSSDGRRVWLSGTAKDELIRHGLFSAAHR